MLTTLAIALATTTASTAQPNPFQDLITRPEPLQLAPDEKWTAPGTLDASDLVDVDGARMDIWPLVLPPGTWNIQIQSDELDPYMSIFLQGDNGLASAKLKIDDDDNGWTTGAAGITGRTNEELLIGVLATSFDADTFGNYEIVVRKVADTYPALPFDALAQINDTQFAVQDAIDWYLEDGPYDLTEAISYADEIVKLRTEHQGKVSAGWWELATARHNAAYLRQLSKLSQTQFLELQSAEATMYAGDDLSEQDDDEAATASYKRAIAGYERVLGPDHVSTAEAISRLGDALYYLDEYDPAIEHYEKTVEIYEKHLGLNHPDTARAMSDLGGMYFYLQNYEAAHANFTTMLQIDRATLDPRNPAIATSLGNLASTKVKLAMMTGARRLYEESVELHLQFYGAEHLQTATQRYALGDLLFDMQEFEAARDQLARAAPAYEQTFGADHPETLQVLDDLAYSEHAMGAYAQAIQHFQTVIAGRAEIPEMQDQMKADSRHTLALCLEATGDLAGALAQHQQVLAFWIKAEGEDHDVTRRTREDIARVEAAMK